MSKEKSQSSYLTVLMPYFMGGVVGIRIMLLFSATSFFTYPSGYDSLLLAMPPMGDEDILKADDYVE